jgi:hypothetical protein
MQSSQALQIVYRALEMVNELRPPEDALASEPDLVLVGDEGALDSLALTTLVLAIESRVADLTGREIVLLDDADFEEQMSAFRTPATLAELIVAKFQQ